MTSHAATATSRRARCGTRRRAAGALRFVIPTDHGSYFCIHCVMAGTDVKRFQQVNQIVRPLEHAKDFRYMKTTCSNCSRDLKCVGYFG